MTDSAKIKQFIRIKNFQEGDVFYISDLYDNLLGANFEFETDDVRNLLQAVVFGYTETNAMRKVNLESDGKYVVLNPNLI